MKSYGQMLDDVYALGTSLTDMGLKGKRIAVMGENCSQWAISYLGIICGTGIVVPVDKELSLQEVQVLIERAEVNAVIFTAKYEKLFKTIKSCGETVLETLININAEEDEDGVLAWQPLVKKGGELIEKGDRRFIDAEIDNEKMCALLFTSGTTGVSKGVMLSHKNLALDLMASPTVLKVNDWEAFARLIGVPVQCLATLAGGDHVCTTYVPIAMPALRKRAVRAARTRRAQLHAALAQNRLLREEELLLD